MFYCKTSLIAFYFTNSLAVKCHIEVIPMSNVLKIKKHTMREEMIVMKKILNMAESMALLAKTPEQAERMNARLEKMKAKLQDFKERVDRLEQP